MTDRGHFPLSRSAEARPGRGGGAGVTTAGIEHLDFGVRNTLLYYKDLKTTLDLTPGTGANQGAVERLLAAERVPLSELFDTGADALRTAAKRVRSISYRARRDVDRGTPGTLCVALGLATWDNGRPTAPAAPIVLRQASVGRHVGTVEDFDLGASGPWNLNVTLLRLMEIDFGVAVDRTVLRELVEELAAHGRPEELFAEMAKQAGEVPGFSIVPRVVLAPVPRTAMVVHEEVATSAPVPLPGALRAGTDGVEEAPEGTSADIVEQFRSGVLNPKKLAEGSLERRIVEKLGPDVIIGEVAETLRGDGWPEALIEHADSGLRMRDRADLLQRWYEASPHRPRPSRWDATHFALWGLAAAPLAGERSILSVARWSDRRHHPVLMAWQVVAEHRAGVRRGRYGPKLGFKSPRAATPRGIDEALWGLPVDLLVEWAVWVFRQWPGAPIELVLPAGTPELLSAWYERARPVAELAVKTWVPFAAIDDDLGKAAHRWVKQLTGACGGGGAPLATWFERSMVAATEAVALRMGEDSHGGPGRGRRAKGRGSLSHAEHAI